MRIDFPFSFSVTYHLFKIPSRKKAKATFSGNKLPFFTLANVHQSMQLLPGLCKRVSKFTQNSP